jgi:shikimate kinase
VSHQHLFLIGPRACGKTTTAAALRECLPGWRVVDLDRLYEQRFKPQQRSALLVHGEHYYAQCRELLFAELAQPQGIIALGGGTLISPQYPGGDTDLLLECKRHGPFVLLLPSRFDWRNRRILFRRESDRDYPIPGSMRRRLRQTCRDQYNLRIDFFRDNADLTVYGSDPYRAARRIVKRFHPPTEAAAP